MGQDNEQLKQKQNLDYVIRSGIAGGVSGCMVRSVVYADCFLLNLTFAACLYT